MDDALLACSAVELAAPPRHLHRPPTSTFCSLRRLADLLDAPALMAECVAVLECIAPGPELFAPLLALAEGRQYHARLQRLQARHPPATCAAVPAASGNSAGQQLLGSSLGMPNAGGRSSPGAGRPLRPPCFLPWAQLLNHVQPAIPASQAV